MSKISKATVRLKPPNKKGYQYLYLDFYPPIINSEGNETRRESLNRYVYIDKNDLKKQIDKLKKEGKDYSTKNDLYKTIKPLNQLQKNHNREQIAYAERIRSKRQNELDKPEVYTDFELQKMKQLKKLEVDTIEFFYQLANKKEGSNYKTWRTVITYFESFVGTKLTFKDLNLELIEEFKEYLISARSIRSNKVQLSQNSASSYFNKFKAMLREAYKKGYLIDDLNSQVDSIGTVDTNREYLSKEEVIRLNKTECDDPLLKRASMFSIFTGLRHSDVKNLTWKQVKKDQEGDYIDYQMQKTLRFEFLPISKTALHFLGDRKDDDEKVFAGLQYSAYQNKILVKWLTLAGITKEITFHNFRHTYACNFLIEGGDIYTLKELLGHKSIKTTEIYAKVANVTKRKATQIWNIDL